MEEKKRDENDVIIDLKNIIELAQDALKLCDEIEALK